MRGWIFVVSLAGCVDESVEGLATLPANPPEEAPWAAQGDLPEQAPPPGVMSLTVAALVPGRHAVFDLWEGGSLVAGQVLFGSHPGRTCLPQLGGACLDLGNARAVTPFRTDSYGSAQVAVQVPAGFAAPSVWLQAASLGPALSIAVSQTVTAPGGTYAVGNIDVMAQVATFAPGYLLGERVLVPDRVSLEGFGLRASVAGPRGQLALYTDVGGVPGRLVAQSGPLVVAGGVQVEPATAATRIAAGTYWLMATWDQQLDAFQGSNPGHLVSYANHVAGAPLPNVFPAPQTYPGGGFNYFLQVR